MNSYTAVHSWDFVTDFFLVAFSFYIQIFSVFHNESSPNPSMCLCVVKFKVKNRKPIFDVEYSTVHKL